MTITLSRRPEGGRVEARARTTGTSVLGVPEHTPAVQAPLQGGPADRTPRQTVDIVDRWGLDSFPASDPPANW